MLEEEMRVWRGSAKMTKKDKVLSHVIIRNKMALQHPILDYIKSRQYCTGTYKKWNQHMAQTSIRVALLRKLMRGRPTFWEESIVQWLKKNSMTLIN